MIDEMRGRVARAPRGAIWGAAAGAVVLILLLVFLFAPRGDGAPTTRPAAATPPVALAPEPPRALPAYAELGIRLAYARVDRTGIGVLVLVDQDGKEQEVAAARGVFTGIAWAPEGDRLAVSFGPNAATQDVYVVEVAGPRVRALTRDGHSHRPTWSPDGTQIAFGSGAGGGQGKGPIVVALADGSTPARVLSQVATYDDPSWAPDGSSIAVSGEAGRIVLLDPVTGAELKRVELLRDSAPTYSSLTWAADAKALTGVVQRGADLAVFILAENLTMQRQVGGAVLGAHEDPAAAHPSWTPDGGYLVAASAATGHIMLLDVTASPEDTEESAPGLVGVLIGAPRGMRLLFPAVSAVLRPAAGQSNT